MVSDDRGDETSNSNTWNILQAALCTDFQVCSLQRATWVPWPIELKVYNNKRTDILKIHPFIICAFSDENAIPNLSMTKMPLLNWA